MSLFRRNKNKHRDQQPIVVSKDGKREGDISNRYATDDRTVITTTADSESIAHEILKCAQEVAASKKIGEEFSIVLESRHPSVHHHEIAFSVMMGAHEHRLQPGAVFNNVFYFTKL